MAAISFVNSKGGSGKTTLALVLAQEMARRGASVAVIDADPNAIIHSWAETRKSNTKKKMPFDVVACPSEAAIAKIIEDLSGKYDFVFIDLEGTSNQIVSRALSRSHLVLIPFNHSPIDASLAAAGAGLVETEIHILGRKIEYRLVASRTNAAIKTKSAKRIEKSINDNEVQKLNTSLVERAAYRDIFDFGYTLEELDSKETSGIEQAQANASEIADEVLNVLKSIQQEEAGK